MWGGHRSRGLRSRPGGAADPDAHFTGHDLVESDPFSLFADVLDDLKGTIRPTLLVIEDMHWADEATLDFLRYIGRRVADTKAVVACTYREDELGPVHPLRTVLGDLATRQSTVRFPVDPLTVDVISEVRVLDPYFYIGASS